MLPCLAREFYSGSIHKLRKCKEVSGVTASVMVTREPMGFTQNNREASITFERPQKFL